MKVVRISVVCLGLLVSCSGEPAAPVSTTCVQDSACADGYVCLDNECVRACSTSQHCTSLEVCQRGICIFNAEVEILSVSKQVLNGHPSNSVAITWTAKAPGAFDVRVGNNCFEGFLLGGVNTSGVFEIGQQITSEVLGMQLQQGPNDVRICLTTDRGDFDAATEITRNDGSPAALVSPPAGVFFDPIVVEIACEDPNPQAIVYGFGDTQPSMTIHGHVTSGIAYEGPIAIDGTTKLNVACLDRAGNIGPTLAQTYTLVPFVKFTHVQHPSISGSGGLFSSTELTFQSSLPGNYAIMTSGSCDHGIPYGGTGSTGTIQRNTPRTVVIAASALPNGEGSYPIRACVTGPGGIKNSAVQTITRDDTPPTSHYAVPYGTDLTEACAPLSVSLSCEQCVGIAYAMNETPQFGSGGAVTVGQVYEAPITVYESGNLHFRSIDGAGNQEPDKFISINIEGIAPAIEQTSVEHFHISSNTEQNSTKLDWMVTPVSTEDIDFQIRLGSCATESAEGLLASGTIEEPQVSITIEADDLPLNGTRTVSTVFLCADPENTCPGMHQTWITRQDASQGAKFVHQIQPPLLDLEFQDSFVTGTPAVEEVLWSVSHTDLNGPFEPIGTAVSQASRYRGLRFELWPVLPENAPLHFEVTMDGLFDPAGNPFPSVSNEALWSASRNEDFRFMAHPLLSGREAVWDNQRQLTWYVCSHGQTWNGSTCTGTPGAVSWVDALSACEPLNDAAAAGASNWRLPRLLELLSLLDWERDAAPYLDPDFFPGQAADVPYWTASGARDSDPLAVHRIDFARPATGAVDPTELLYVRCVSGGDHPVTPNSAPGSWNDEGVFIESLAGSVFWDRVSQIGWERNPPDSGQTYAEAVARCDELELGGLTDWYLPALGELYSLVRLDRVPATSPRLTFPDANAFYWSTTEADTASQHVLRYAATIDSQEYNKDTLHHSRCATRALVP